MFVLCNCSTRCCMGSEPCFVTHVWQLTGHGHLQLQTLIGKQSPSRALNQYLLRSWTACLNRKRKENLTTDFRESSRLHLILALLSWRLLCPFDTRRTACNSGRYPVSCRSNADRSPHLRPLFRYPGQQKVGGDSKIPSVVCYDGRGNVVAVGSETDIDTNPELFETEGLVRAEWYAPSLFPQTLFYDDNIGSSYISDQPILLPNKGSMSKIYLPFRGTRQSLISSATS